MNENSCEELLVLVYTKRGKRKINASEVVSIVHSHKENAARIKITIASEVSKHIGYTPNDGVDGSFFKTFLQTYAN